MRNIFTAIEERRFRRFLLIPLGQLYDPGLEESDPSKQPELFNSRANFLLKNKFLQLSFGFYRVEYSIIDNVAYSHYSLNNGMTFVMYKEMKLSKNPKRNIEGLARLISDTESILRYTIVKRTPPYTKNF